MSKKKQIKTGHGLQIPIPLPPIHEFTEFTDAAHQCMRTGGPPLIMNGIEPPVLTARSNCSIGTVESDWSVTTAVESPDEHSPSESEMTEDGVQGSGSGGVGDDDSTLEDGIVFLHKLSSSGSRSLSIGSLSDRTDRSDSSSIYNVRVDSITANANTNANANANTNSSAHAPNGTASRKIANDLAIDISSPRVLSPMSTMRLDLSFMSFSPRLSNSNSIGCHSGEFLMGTSSGSGSARPRRLSTRMRASESLNHLAPVSVGVGAGNISTSSITTATTTTTKNSPLLWEDSEAFEAADGLLSLRSSNNGAGTAASVAVMTESVGEVEEEKELIALCHARFLDVGLCVPKNDSAVRCADNHQHLLFPPPPQPASASSDRHLQDEIERRSPDTGRLWSLALQQQYPPSTSPWPTLLSILHEKIQSVELVSFLCRAFSLSVSKDVCAALQQQQQQQQQPKGSAAMSTGNSPSSSFSALESMHEHTASSLEPFDVFPLARSAASSSSSSSQMMTLSHSAAHTPMHCIIRERLRPEVQVQQADVQALARLLLLLLVTHRANATLSMQLCRTLATVSLAIVRQLDTLIQREDAKFLLSLCVEYLHDKPALCSHWLSLCAALCKNHSVRGLLIDVGIAPILVQLVSVHYRTMSLMKQLTNFMKSLIESDDLHCSINQSHSNSRSQLSMNFDGVAGQAADGASVSIAQLLLEAKALEPLTRALVAHKNSLTVSSSLCHVLQLLVHKHDVATRVLGGLGCCEFVVEIVHANLRNCNASTTSSLRDCVLLLCSLVGCKENLKRFSDVLLSLPAGGDSTSPTAASLSSPSSSYRSDHDIVLVLLRLIHSQLLACHSILTNSSTINSNSSGSSSINNMAVLSTVTGPLSDFHQNLTSGLRISSGSASMLSSTATTAAISAPASSSSATSGFVDVVNLSIRALVAVTVSTQFPLLRARLLTASVVRQETASLSGFLETVSDLTATTAMTPKSTTEEVCLKHDVFSLGLLSMIQLGRSRSMAESSLSLLSTAVHCLLRENTSSRVGERLVLSAASIERLLSHAISFVADGLLLQQQQQQQSPCSRVHGQLASLICHSLAYAISLHVPLSTSIASQCTSTLTFQLSRFVPTAFSTKTELSHFVALLRPAVKALKSLCVCPALNGSLTQSDKLSMWRSLMTHLEYHCQYDSFAAHAGMDLIRHEMLEAIQSLSKSVDVDIPDDALVSIRILAHVLSKRFVTYEDRSFGALLRSMQTMSAALAANDLMTLFGNGNGNGNNNSSGHGHQHSSISASLILREVAIGLTTSNAKEWTPSLVSGACWLFIAVLNAGKSQLSSSWLLQTAEIRSLPVHLVKLLSAHRLDAQCAAHCCWLIASLCAAQPLLMESLLKLPPSPSSTAAGNSANTTPSNSSSSCAKSSEEGQLLIELYKAHAAHPHNALLNKHICRALVQLTSAPDVVSRFLTVKSRRALCGMLCRMSRQHQSHTDVILPLCIALWQLLSIPDFCIGVLSAKQNPEKLSRSNSTNGSGDALTPLASASFAEDLMHSLSQQMQAIHMTTSASAASIELASAIKRVVDRLLQLVNSERVQSMM